MISIHAPPRGATPQPTLPAVQQRISIHAPPRGATHHGQCRCLYSSISIHAPPRGATRTEKLTYELLYNFNSRPSARGDRHTHLHSCIGYISIHAPPRGATDSRPPSANQLDYFNSRPSARGDGKRYAISANLLFNPYKSAWLNNSATQFVEIILVIFHRIIA